MAGRLPARLENRSLDGMLFVGAILREARDDRPISNLKVDSLPLRQSVSPLR